MVYNSDHALHATRHTTYIRKCTGHESMELCWGQNWVLSVGASSSVVVA